MPSTKDSYGEDVSLLYPDNQNDKFNRFSETHCETPIIKGVVNQLRKWPTDLFFAFLAACLILGSLVFLIFVTVAVSLPTVVCCREEEMAMLEMGPSPSVYFLKLGNQNWSTMDLCYIETAAYRHPDLNVKFQLKYLNFNVNNVEICHADIFDKINEGGAFWSEFQRVHRK